MLKPVHAIVGTSTSATPETVGGIPSGAVCGLLRSFRNLVLTSLPVSPVSTPSRAEPSRAEPSRAEPSRAEPSRAEPSRAVPSASSCSRLDHSASRSESSASVGRSPAFRRSPSSSFDNESSAGVRHAARRLRLGLLTALLCLSLLAGLAAPAAAQTPTANPDGSYTVPIDWPLIPSGLRQGDKFRLLFVTSTTLTLSSSNIGTYNTYVQNRAATGHTDIRPYSLQFRVLGSTSAVDARDNTETTGTGVPIYWLDGEKVADNYADFYDGSWDSQAGTTETGGSPTGGGTNINVWTGSANDGTEFFSSGSSRAIGQSQVRYGRLNSSGRQISFATDNVGHSGRHLYALSPVFVVQPPQPPAELSLIWTETIPPLPLPREPKFSTGREVGKQVKETDSGTTNVFFYVRTERLHSSKLPFRVCVSGDATQSTTNSPQPEAGDDFQVVLDGVVQGRCFNSSIPANQRYKRLAVTILNDDRLEDRSRDTEHVVLTLSQAPGNPLPSPYEIASNSGYWKLSLGIIDDDFWQQPVQFSPAEYELFPGMTIPRSQTRRVKEALAWQGSERVSLMFTKGPDYTPYTVTYRVVHAESTATYGADYTLVGYNRNTDRGTIQVPGPLQGGAALRVNVVDDSRVEGEEQFVIEMVDVSGPLWVNRENDRHKLSIKVDDNDNPAYLRVSPERTTLSGDGAERLITMSAGVPLPVDVHFEYCVEAGTATPGTDYELTGPDGAKVTGTGCNLVTLPAGSAGIDLTVRMLDGDDRVEPDEQVKIRLRKSTVPGRETSSSTVEIKILPSTVERDKDGNEVNMAAIVTLKDDDMPTLEVAGQKGAGQDGKLIAFTVRALNGPFDRNLDLHWELDDPGDLIDGDTKTVTRTRPCTQFLRDVGFCTGSTHTYTTESPVHRKKSGIALLARGKTKVHLDFLVRDSGPDGSVTLKASEGKSFRLVPGKGSACVAIRDGACSGGQGSSDDTVVPPQPTAAVSNVQVTAVDATSATVTWDAVEHATSYRVEYAGTASDPANNVQGSVEGHADTTWTFRHDAAEAMTVTVTVTPEYVDGNGDTQRLADLAGTATLDVAPAGTQDADPQDTVGTAVCDTGSLKSDIAGYIGEQADGTPHVTRWKQVLAALGDANGHTAMTAAEAQTYADRGWSRWDPVVTALTCLEAAAAQPETPAAVPEIAVSGGNGITEGGNASFTVTATPAPSAPLAVTLTVGQSGDYAASGETGTRQVTVPTGGSVAIEVATADDAADEPDGSVSATVEPGTGYTVGSANTASVSVADDDDPVPDPVTPELRLSAGTAVDEGGNAVFTVHADAAPAADLTVALTVSQTGDVLGAPAGSRQLTLAAGATSVTLTLATADDGVDEPDGSVSVTLHAGAGYTVAAGQAAGTVAVRDNDEPVVSIAAGSGVTEGNPASFTLTANPVPHAALTVSLAVTQSGDFAASGQTDTRQVTIPVAGSTSFEVATVNDGADEPDGSVTATLAAGSGYAVAASPDDTASVAVADDDVAAVPQGPSLSVNDVEVKEGPYRRVEFTVTLSKALEKGVWFYYRVRESDPVSAKRGVDFSASAGKKFASMRPGATEHRIMAALVIDDSHDEDPETFEIVLSDAHGAVIADGVGVATIVNDDPMPAAFLSRFGRTAAEQALDGIAARIAAPRDPGVSGSFAGHVDLGSLAARGDAGTGEDSVHDTGTALAADGHGIGIVPSDDHGPALAFLADDGGDGSGNAARGSLSGDVFASGHDGVDGAEVRSVTLEDAILATGFTATRGTDAAGGSLAFWGRADLSGFDGREGTFSLDGEAATAMLGADYARGRWLAGLMVMQSSGDGGYADAGTGDMRCPQELDAVHCGGAVREGDGDVEASLTAAVPYAAYQVSERIRLWGALGRGTGEVTLEPETGGGPLAADLSWSMAAAGLRGDLRAPSGAFPALAVTADALATRTSSDATDGLAASESDTSRLRVGIEGSWDVALDGGGRLRPRLEIGARHDGGDAETGLGIELGGGVSWTDPGLGVSLDLSGRTLVLHDDNDLADRGVSLSVTFDPDPDTTRGPTISMKQDLGGAASGGIDALFAHDPLTDRAGDDTGVRRTLEAAWGLPAFGGRFTGSPHAGLSTAGDARDWTLGWRLAPEGERPGTPDLTFGTRAVRREGGDGAATHSLGVEAGIRW